MTGAFSILPCAESDSALFSSDDRIKVVSFTGSPKVGWYVKNNCGGHKKVCSFLLVTRFANVGSPSLLRLVDVIVFYRSEKSLLCDRKYLILLFFQVLLELGGNAAVIVDKDADLDRAAERILFGAFYYAGQSCISVQVRMLLVSTSCYLSLLNVHTCTACSYS